MRKLAALNAALIAAGVLVASCTAGRPDLAGMSFSAQPLPGKIVWHDLVTDAGDIATIRRFYGELFGWTFEESRGVGGRDYLVARSGDVYVAGILPVEPRADGQNVARWLPYVSVADVDDALKSSVEAGATVAVGPRNVSLGRVAAIIDTEGAVIGLARSRYGDPDDRTTRPGPGRAVWTELLAGDPARAAGFYTALAGYRSQVIERRGGEYTMLESGGQPRAGLFEKPSDEIASTWLTHFGVRDPAAVAERVTALGGTVLLPVSPELREGTVAVVTDPSGAALVLKQVGS